MPRIDDYRNARKIAIETLSEQALTEISERSGFELEDETSFIVPFLNRVFRVQFPDFKFSDQADADIEIPIQEQILILHYMLAPGAYPLTGQWVAYREIPGASFYFSAFAKRAIDPLKNVFGKNLSGLSKASALLNGRPIEPGDAGFEFDILPNVPLQLILYAADEEFPAEANILFDRNIGEILSPEDIAWLAGMLVYRLIVIAKS
jgi:hypothetical protein